MSIPFYTELKRLTGSTNAALLMQQNEHYFCYSPDGFYKFLTPCGIPECRPGDSWVEVLECSKKELYGAFEGIRCIRYGSQADFVAAVAAGQVFGEHGNAWYCTWYDRASYKTMHLRNHPVVEAALIEVGYPPALERHASDKREHAGTEGIADLSEDLGKDPSDKRELGKGKASDKREHAGTEGISDTSDGSEKDPSDKMELEQVTKGNLGKLQKGTWPSDKRELVLIGTDIKTSDIRSSDILSPPTCAHEGLDFSPGTPVEYIQAITAICLLPAPGGKQIDQMTAERMILQHGLSRIQQELIWLPDRNASSPAVLFQHVLKSSPKAPAALSARAAPTHRQRTRNRLIEELAKETQNYGQP